MTGRARSNRPARRTRKKPRRLSSNRLPLIEVFFVSNRNLEPRPDVHFGERFNSDGPMFFRVGRAFLSKVSDHFDKGYRVEGVEIFDESLGEDQSGNKVEKVLGSSELFSELRERMFREGKDVIVLIHGFATTFVESLQRAAQIKQAYLIESGGNAAYEPYVVVFSWPSNGRIFPPWEYHDDRQDAAASGTAIARFITRFVDFLSGTDGKCPLRIHLVAHSMGNWALRNAVQAMTPLIDNAKYPTIFTNAFLMAADDDEDTFEKEHKMGRLPELARSIHVYHGRDDQVLIISDVTKFNPDRLGSGGPKSFSGLSNRITAIDCSNVNETFIQHGKHQYYRIREEVIADVRAILSGQFLPDQVPGRVVIESGRRYRISGPSPVKKKPRTRRGAPGKL